MLSLDTLVLGAIKGIINLEWSICGKSYLKNLPRNEKYVIKNAVLLYLLSSCKLIGKHAAFIECNKLNTVLMKTWYLYF